MEFGIFVQGHLPGPAAHDRAAEHRALMQEIDYIVCADRNNWKYAWFSEHHALPEYSHISANETFMGFCAARTSRIHLGSGIFNLSPRACHPVRNAERAAMLDHLTEGRFEMGTGRGAGSHEVGTFNIHDTSSTRSEWDEVVWEIPRMWAQLDYTFQGKHFALDVPHNILPKAVRLVAPAHLGRVRQPTDLREGGRHGIGALGFNFSTIHEMTPMIEAYKQGGRRVRKPRRRVHQQQRDDHQRGALLRGRAEGAPTRL
jgi:alkanesulfonate monooxygenase SsuD/methylene tetrahydromethanopterin reductase-like flavin-dependent oxidoreductase (luciferase family)